MAFEDLLKSVEESAEEKERELQKKAAGAVEEIRARSRQRAKEIRESLVNDARTSVETEKNKMLYLTRVEIKALLISAREAAFRKAFAEAGNKLASVRADPRYPAIFERLFREAAESFGDSPFVIHIDKRDAELNARFLKVMGRNNRIQDDIVTAGGVVLSSPDNSVVISNTVESRLERARETKRQEIHAILNG